MQTQKHPRIVMFLGAGQMASNNIFLVSEFLNGGDLFSRLERKTHTLSWTDRLIILRDIAEGMAFFHSKNMIHRDLKSLNVLLDLKGRAKIADFGLSRFTVNTAYKEKDHKKNKKNTDQDIYDVEDDDDDDDDDDFDSDSNSETKEDVTMTGSTGSLPWVAPEVFQMTGWEDGKMRATYGLPADVYSFAIVGWEVITRRMPWMNLSHPKFSKIKNNVVNGKRPPMSNAERDVVMRCVPGLLELIENAWDQKPEHRPTFNEILLRLRSMKEM
tara:strand:+ start:2250 stop:3062 length:813 start_codon:yes stop_codon:yes gene_type:complete